MWIEPPNPNIRAKYQSLDWQTQPTLDILDDWEIVSKKFFKQKHFPMTFLEADGDYDESDDSSSGDVRMMARAWSRPTSHR
jgi:hypothetical protein